MRKLKKVRDPDMAHIVASMPDGYRVVCTRCAMRNGFHHEFCALARKRNLQEVSTYVV